MLEYALLLVVLTFFYNVFVFLMMISLKKQNCLADFQSIFNAESKKASNDSSKVNKLHINTMNIHILQSNFDVNKLVISLPTHIFERRDLLSIFIAFHELGHYHQINLNNKLINYLRKNFVFKYANVLSLLLTLIIYVRTDYMNLLEVKLSLIVLAVPLIYSTVFNFFVINKLEKNANNYALEISSKLFERSRRTAFIVRLLRVREFLNVAIFPILYVMMIWILL